MLSACLRSLKQHYYPRQFVVVHQPLTILAGFVYCGIFTIVGLVALLN